MTRVVVLGGGVGGTMVANRLAHRRRDLDIVVVDSHGDHLFQPALVHVPFGRNGVTLERDERDLLRPGVRLLVERVERLDPQRRRIHCESGTAIDYDWLVIATGSRLMHDALPGGREANHQFHCPKGAERLRTALESFRGGRIVVGAHSLPYKCPPSPLEFTFLLDDWLRERGLREATQLSYVYPLEDVQPLAPVARLARPLLEERGIEFHTSFASPEIDPSRKTLSSGSRSVAFDLLVLVPPHCAAPFLRESELAEPGGWVRTDPRTLRVQERIYALGDTTNLPRPKSGSAAHFQSRIVAENILAEVDGREPQARYDGRVVCFLETGGGRATTVDFTYDRAPEPHAPDYRTSWKKALLWKFYFHFVRRA